MFFIYALVAPVFTLGFAVMTNELLKAPLGVQDEHGFHLMPESTRRRLEQPSQQPDLSYSGVADGVQAAHAR